MHLKYFLGIAAVVLLFSYACNNTSKDKKEIPAQQLDATQSSIKILSEKIKLNPKDGELYNQRASIYLQLKNIDSAFRDINRALMIDSVKADYLSTLSDVYMASGRVQNALAALEKALKFEPDNIVALLKKAELHLYFEQYGKTMDLTEKVLKLDINNSKAYFIRGMTFKLKGDTADAIKNIQKTVELDQENYNAFMQLGILYAAKRNKMAVEYYNNALKLNPKSIEAFYALGMFYQDNGFLNEALSSYTNLLLIDSTYKFAHYNMGYIHLVYLKMYKEAIKYFNKAIKFAPDYYEAYYNRGYCFELLGDILNARKDYKKALEIKNNYEMAIEGLNRLDKRN